MLWSTHYPDCRGYQMVHEGILYANPCGNLSAIPVEAMAADRESPDLSGSWGYEGNLESRPAFADDVMVVGGSGGTLVAFDVS
jgi:hypothetical protein